MALVGAEDRREDLPARSSVVFIRLSTSCNWGFVRHLDVVIFPCRVRSAKHARAASTMRSARGVWARTNACAGSSFAWHMIVPAGSFRSRSMRRSALRTCVTTASAVLEYCLPAACACHSRHPVAFRQNMIIVFGVSASTTVPLPAHCQSRLRAQLGPGKRAKCNRSFSFDASGVRRGASRVGQRHT